MSSHSLINIPHTTDVYSGGKPILSYPGFCVGPKVKKYKGHPYYTADVDAKVFQPSCI